MLIMLLTGFHFLSIVNCSLAQPINDKATYVGAGKCKQCHKDIYKGWKSTLHPYKFQHASPVNVAGDFSKNNHIEIDGKTTTMFEKNKEYFITTTGPDNKEHTYKVVYVIGEFWKQLYVTEFSNGELHILPAMWIVKTRSWQKSKYWSDTIYQYSCSGCHNTGTQINFDKSSNTFNTTWSDMGVACEACHGPAGDHLNAEKNDKSATIVNPAKIPDPGRASNGVRIMSYQGHFC